MSTFLGDVRFALRLLAKDRSFTVTALLTLAICIGANTAMFSIVQSVLLKPLPFPESDRMVLLYNSYPEAGAPRVGAAVPDYYDRLTAVPALDEQALFRREGMNYGDETGAERLQSLSATPSFYRMVRVQPVEGRLFSDDEGEVGKNQKVILGYGFWQRKFAGRASIVGQAIRLGGSPYDVVGVMPPEFSFLEANIDVYMAAAFSPNDKSDGQRHSNNWQMVGHLKRGASIGLVQQQVDTLNVRNFDRFPEFRQLLTNAHFHTVAVFLQDDVVRDVKAMLYLLWGGVLFVLLIGCVNIANLVIVRSSGRTREMATRHAIGGDLGRLARQLVTETTILALGGGLAGLVLGWWALRSISALNLNRLPRGYEIHLDPVSVLVILALTLLVGVCLGIAPVTRLRHMNLNVELREESRGGTSGRRANLVRRVLATAQVTIALVVLVGAGLLLASFRAVMHLDFGFSPDRVETGVVNLPGTSYKDNPAMVAFEQRALQAIRALPEVEAAGGASAVPLSGNTSSNIILAEGYVMKPGESLIAPFTFIATSGYFEAMHTPCVRGRAFDARDTADAPRVAVVDERLARKFWPDQDPIGRRLYRPTDAKDVQKITPQTQFITVVGVVKDVQFLAPSEDVGPVGTVYYPFEQAPTRGLTFTIKTRGASPQIVNRLRQELARLDPQLPLFRTQSMQEYIDLALLNRRAPMFIAMAFGVVALLLSALGIYGVLAYSVSERRRELGVRMALGGSAANVFGLVLKDGLRIVGVGLGAGLVVSLIVGQFMKHQLFGVTPMNPMVLALVTVVLLAVALVASTIPAWRASRINPIVVLSR